MKKYLVLPLLILGNIANAQIVTQQNILQGVNLFDADSIELNQVILDRIIYDDNVYSTSKKTEVGDSTELSMAVRYHVAPLTFTRFRFVTDPIENRYNNKTSRFELVFSKMFDKIQLQFDLDLLTNDTEDEVNSGGTSIGPDLDSDDTFIAYNHSDNFSLIFYPFNFRSDVGDEFNTIDVSRIISIEGSPNTVAASPVGSERIVSKTIPGLEVNFHKGGHTLYAGLGMGTYFFPKNSNFNIETNPSANGWNRKETTAYKLGYLYLFEQDSKVSFQSLLVTNTEETGSLLQSAASINIFQRFGKMIFEYETTMTKAGESPYNVDLRRRWFTNQTPFLPVFSDVNGNRQNWINKLGFAHSLKLGLNFDKITPFVSLKYQGEHFIFDGDESAHRLRTNDETKSHGGLWRFGVGTFFYHGNMFIRPQVEYQMANNPVFSNSTDQRNDRILSSFKDSNLILSLNMTYTFDNFSANQLWWF